MASSRYSVTILPGALRQLRALPTAVQARLREALDGLAGDPRPPPSKLLKGGERQHRLRVGDYRAIYSIDDAGRTVLVMRVAHRRDVYRGL